MKKKGVLGNILAILVLASTIVACGGPKVELKLRLEAGKTYRQQMTAEQQISQQALGQKVDIDQTIGFGYAFHVREVDNAGVATVDVTYESVRYRLNSPQTQTTIDYDSSNPPAELPAGSEGFAVLIGKSFSMKVSPTGEILDVQGVDAMLQQIVAELSQKMGSEADSLLEGLQEQFGDQAIKENMQGAFDMYPDKPIGIGDSWTRKMALSKGFALITDCTYTLKSLQDGVATLAVRCQIQSNKDAAPLEISGVSLRYDLSGQQEGTMQVRETSGWVIGGQVSQKISGKAEVQGLSIPISITSTVQYESPPE